MLSTSEQSQIEAAIADAEELTSAEIKVVIKRHCWGSLHEAAQRTFYELKLDKTRLRNAALIYVVVAHKEFLIFGDRGIDDVVPDDFWVEASSEMTVAFRDESLAAGIVTGVKIIGTQLAEHFPAGSENPDEISNDVVVDDA